MVKADGSWPIGCCFKPRHRILDGCKRFASCYIKVKIENKGSQMGHNKKIFFFKRETSLDLLTTPSTSLRRIWPKPQGPPWISNYCAAIKFAFYKPTAFKVHPYIYWNKAHATMSGLLELFNSLHIKVFLPTASWFSPVHLLPLTIPTLFLLVFVCVWKQ